MSESPRETHEDRFLEIALEEECGAAMPPDVSGRLRWEIARQEQGQDRIGLLETEGTRRRSLKIALTAAAGFLLGCLAMFGLTASSSQQGPTPVLVFAVEKGRLEWEGQYGSGYAVASQSRGLAVSVGDRWAAVDGSAQTVVKLAGFGSLIMKDDCIVEVKDVDWKTFGGGAAVGAVVVAVIAGVLDFDSGSAIQAAGKGDNLVLAAKDDPAQSLDVSALQEELAAARSQIGSLKNELDRTRLASAEPVLDPVAVPDSGAESAVDEAGSEAARFSDREFAELLASIDFEKCGVALHAMSAMTDGIVGKLDDESGDLPIAELAALSKENVKLLESMVELFGSDVPGTGPNGKYSNPLVQANLIDAMLNKAGVGLDEGQQRAMEDMTARFGREDAQRLSAYGPESTMLEKLIGETSLRQRFFDEMEASLRPEQTRFLHGDKSRGVVGLDLHSSGLVWQQVIQGGSFEVSDRNELGQEIGFRVRRILGAKGEQAAQLKAAVANWAQNVPETYWSQPSSRRANLGLGNTAYVANAAQQQLALYREILATVNLSTQQRERLIGTAKVFVPYRRKG